MVFVACIDRTPSMERNPTTKKPLVSSKIYMLLTSFRNAFWTAHVNELPSMGRSRSATAAWQVAYFLIATFTIGCSQTSRNSAVADMHYPTPLPTDTAMRFLPDLVSSQELDFNAAFARDGNTFYFSRSHHGKYVVYETRFDRNQWTTPEPSVLFDTLYSNTDPFITADGSIYFISNRPKDSADTLDDYDIYKLPKTESGFAPALRLSGVNSDSTEYYVSLANNGNLYFASYRDGNLDLYSSAPTSKGYESPRKLGPLNSAYDEHDPFIAGDESFIVFTSSRPGGLGEADLYLSFRQNESWLEPVNMGHRINTPSYDYCPYVTADGQFFFFSSEWDVKWINASVLKAPADRRSAN